MTKEELHELTYQVSEMEIALKRVKGEIFSIDNHISEVHEVACHVLELAKKLVDSVEEIEHNHFKLQNIDVDQYFQDNPVSEYVQAGIDYLSGDEDAVKRMTNAVARMDANQKVEVLADVPQDEEEAISLLEFVQECDEEYMEVLATNLFIIDEELSSIDMNEWEEEDIELARYALRHMANANQEEVDQLSTEAIKLAWKRRKYLGALD